MSVFLQEASLELKRVSSSEFRISGRVPYFYWEEHSERIDEITEIRKSYRVHAVAVHDVNDDGNYGDDTYNFTLHEFEFLGLPRVTIRSPKNSQLGDDWYRVIEYNGEKNNFETSQNHYVAKLDTLQIIGFLKDVYGISHLWYGKDSHWNIDYKKQIKLNKTIPIALCGYGFGCACFCYIGLARFLKLDWSKFNLGKIPHGYKEDNSINVNQRALKKFLVNEFKTDKPETVTPLQKSEWLIKYINEMITEKMTH